MTDEVAELVLADNRDQNAVLGVARAHAAGDGAACTPGSSPTCEARRGLDPRARGAARRRGLRRAGGRGRRADQPGAGHAARAHQARPHDRRCSPPTCPTPPRSPAGCPEYFPRPLRERFPAAIAAHPLRREIVTTLLVNEMVDGAGITYAFRLGEELSAERRPTPCAPTRSPRRCSTCRRCGRGCATPHDPDRGVRRGRAGVAPAARPGVALVPHQPAAAADRRVGDRAVRRAGARAAGRACPSCCAAGSSEMVAERAPQLQEPGSAASSAPCVRRPRCTATGCSTSSS